ncbi:hypothetical protein OPQ81_008131 [Rhizoctonia solani]|nr:hypothetical protein OPQ81_008131 [Rhizoctonia solani]
MVDDSKACHPLNQGLVEVAGGADNTISRKHSSSDWMNTLWSCVIHFILSLGIAGLIIFYVKDRSFNVDERSASVQIVGGILHTPFSPLQSDVVTLLSSIIVLLRCVLMAWAGPLCWRAAFFLMEKRGLPRRDLKTLLTFGILSPRVYVRNFSTLTIGTLLLASLVANFSSPILTGSISWLPINQLIHNLSVSPVQFIDSTLSELPQSYLESNALRNAIPGSGAGFVGIAWGREADWGTLKRVSPSLDGLSINSTIQNVTLPYFKVHSLEWIKNPDDIPTVKDNRTDVLISRVLDWSPVPRDTIIGLETGTCLLIPNITTNWSSDPMDSTIVEDTRLLVVLYGQGDKNITRNIPLNAGTLSLSGVYHHAFAWVKFSAGVGRCSDYRCRISSSSTVQNSTPVALEPHPLTVQSLAHAPIVSLYLTVLNSSLPSPWNSLDSYIEALLVRSYSGAWTALNDRLGKTFVTYSFTASNYVPSLPSLKAYVDIRRVFIWLAIHLFVTVLSSVFLIIQSTQSNYPLIGNTTLTSFYLDTTEIPRSGKATVFREGGMLKVEPQGDRFKVKLE